MLGVPVDQDGWFVERQRGASPTDTCRAGIHITGVCQGPKDIPDTVAQASAAAAMVIQSIVRSRATGTSGDTTVNRSEDSARQITGQL